MIWRCEQAARVDRDRGEDTAARASVAPVAVGSFCENLKWTAEARSRIRPLHRHRRPHAAWPRTAAVMCCSSGARGCPDVRPRAADQRLDAQVAAATLCLGRASAAVGTVLRPGRTRGGFVVARPKRPSVSPRTQRENGSGAAGSHFWSEGCPENFFWVSGAGRWRARLPAAPQPEMQRRKLRQAR